jgi:16S rRNA (uracil1498-N3)-methyltransferase
VWLAVGPESGLDAAEVEARSGAGWIRTGLGPRVLRADTAGLVAASVLLHQWADLGADSFPEEPI